MIGVLVELASETDFVAKSEDFQTAANDIAMHVAATRPRWVTRDEVPEEILAKEKSLIEAQARNEGKPDHIIDKIVEGRVGSFYKDNVLYDQTYIRPDRFEGTIGDMVQRMAGHPGREYLGGADRSFTGRRVGRVGVGNRVVLKLSGESFADPDLSYGIDATHRPPAARRGDPPRFTPRGMR